MTKKELYRRLTVDIQNVIMNIPFQVRHNIYYTNSSFCKSKVCIQSVIFHVIRLILKKSMVKSIFKQKKPNL